MKFKKDTYINLIIYILSRCYNKPNLGKTVLCSMLYFIDFEYYEIYGTSLTKETYIKSRKGIKPKHFLEITQDLINQKRLFLRKEPYYNRTIHRYYLTIIPQAKFSEKELEIIDSNINRLSNHNATSIAKYTRDDPPFSMANLGEEIDHRHVFSRKKRKYLINK
ncbi:Panacea domain-containing protein [Methanobrevibacter sp.]|uniref:Panacea domain-containing protein n=1 Tax=Methanobrevibacter sp. TaxID=66852 RepID=UPI0026DEFE22|nr:Panacea domain-containing protein [Methanobrevibacter sp.]MDO5860900.1 Panacea domain-containing protein [Methanobrevibacter sp.]